MMTRKHYELIAASLADSYRAAINETERKTVSAVAYTLAANLSGTNTRFNCQRFLAACGVKGGR